MKLLPRFREEYILREEVALIYQNYFIGILGYFFANVITSIVIYHVTKSRTVFLWTFISAITCFVILYRYWLVKDKETNPVTEATIQVWSLLALGILWGILPLVFSVADSTIVMVTITGMTAGVAAAALTMQSPCLPVFLAFAYTTLPALSLFFFQIEDNAYIGMGIAVIIYLAVLTHFARNLEAMIVQSIQLRFANVDLIEQLQGAVDETKEANRAKSVFLASASHDLRQPLHAMSLFIQTLNGTNLDDYQQKIISHIESASDATREMLNTLLDFSKLDAGVIEPRPRTFRIQPLFTKMENELGSGADSKNLIYRTHETTYAAYTDISLLELILRNLITNAIRYTETGGVLIACRKRRNHKIVVEVWDTGIGIPEDEQQNIFREFHQLGNPERDRQKGFGLGLAIAKGMADTMQLDLTVKSTLKKGSVFRLTLPEAEISVVEDINDNQILTRFDGKCILIIDDDESIRIAMNELLSNWGCDCLLAESEDEALSLIKDKTIDLIIVDYRLREEKTGREAITLIRKEINRDLPAIIITGDTAADRLREAKASDAMLLHKPVMASDLQKTMANLLDN